MAIKYLSIAQFAERVGVTRGTIISYNLPVPDSYIGKTRGWLPSTIDDWQSRRPGRGGTDSGWNLPPEYAHLAPKQATRGRKAKPKPEPVTEPDEVEVA